MLGGAMNELEKSDSPARATAQPGVSSKGAKT